MQEAATVSVDRAVDAGQVGGHQRPGLLVALRADLEQQLRAGLRQRDATQLVNDEQVLLGELLLDCSSVRSSRASSISWISAAAVVKRTR